MATVWLFSISRRAASWLAVMSSTCRRSQLWLHREPGTGGSNGLAAWRTKMDCNEGKYQWPKHQGQDTVYCDGGHPQPCAKAAEPGFVGDAGVPESGAAGQGMSQGSHCHSPAAHATGSSSRGGVGSCRSHLFTALGPLWTISFHPIPSPSTKHSVR